jgi:hypothetical protein
VTGNGFRWVHCLKIDVQLNFFTTDATDATDTATVAARHPGAIRTNHTVDPYELAVALSVRSVKSVVPMPLPLAVCVGHGVTVAPVASVVPLKLLSFIP